MILLAVACGAAVANLYYAQPLLHAIAAGIHTSSSNAALLVTGRDPTSAEAGPWARQWLWSKAAGIAGGTSQVQRDIIAGRILGLPR